MALVLKLNPHMANQSTSKRDKKRLFLDTVGGCLAESGWKTYFNRVFGDSTISFTEYDNPRAQIDLQFSNGKTVEVRSSFPRNGVKFALCNDKFNFKIICKYENLYKQTEVDKDFFLCTLFETQKEDMLSSPEIVFYLAGGVTRKMMLDNNIGFNSDLVAEDDPDQIRTKYRVVQLKNALDIKALEDLVVQMGYEKNTQRFNIGF